MGISTFPQSSHLCRVKNSKTVPHLSLQTFGRQAALPLGGLLLLLHFFIALSFTFFLHTHTLENGEKVVHSHPFTATNAEGEPLHQHPGSVFQLVPDLDQYLEQNPFCFCEPLPAYKKITLPRGHTTSAPHSGAHGLRGPPSCA